MRRLTVLLFCVGCTVKESLIDCRDDPFAPVQIYACEAVADSCYGTCKQELRRFVEANDFFGASLCWERLCRELYGAQFNCAICSPYYVPHGTPNSVDLDGRIEIVDVDE